MTDLERRRLARELQNGVMQSLAALAVQARLAERSDDPAVLKQGLAALREGVTAVLHDLGAVVRC